MATITITPGNSFTPTETVTSTKLNDLGSPTAALTAASIGTADIADDAVTSALIADDAITSALIADNAVTTPAILDANITFAKLTDVIDDDTMATATDTTLATSESIKAYVDGTSSFTTEDSQSAGYQVFPSGLKMAWGEASDSTTSPDDVVTFPTGVNFTVAPTVTISANTVTSSGGAYYAPGVRNVTTTQFQFAGYPYASQGYRYMAIGH